MIYDDIDLFESILSSNDTVALDFETTFDRYCPPICTAQVKGLDGRSVVVQTYGRPDLLNRVLFAINETDALLVAHFAIFELARLKEHNVVPKRMVCTYIAARVLRGAMEGGNFVTTWNLKDLAKRELGVEMDKEVRNRDWREPLDAIGAAYCILDCDVALDLWVGIFDPEFDADPEQRRGFDLIIDALPAIAEINSTGLSFDRKAHADLCALMDDQAAAADIELDIICDGAIANHNSPAQVSRWVAEQISFEPGCSVLRASLLFAQMTGAQWAVTTTGLSMDKKALERLLGPIEDGWPTLSAYLRARLRYKKAKTLLTSFGPNLTDMVDPDERIRGRLIAHGARTSRMSSVQPNLQNQPRLEAFRALYVAPPGRKLIIADYGQIELRVGAILCDDKQMQKFFADGVDLHAATAEAIHQWPGGYDGSNKAHKAARSGGKAVSFGALYGAQAPTIALSSGLPLADAVVLLDRWLEIYPGIRQYRDTQYDKAMAAGGSRLVSGQFVKAVASTRPPQAINLPVQGSAASVMYRAMTRVHAALHADRLDATLCMCVHDELLVEASEADAHAAAIILGREMTLALLDMFPQARALGLGGVADAAIVDRWSDKDSDEFKVEGADLELLDDA